ncbi:hypothetical protein ACFX2C_028374 [Malus domestica]
MPPDDPGLVGMEIKKNQEESAFCLMKVQMIHIYQSMQLIKPFQNQCEIALFVLVHQSVKVGVEVKKLFFSKFGGEVPSCHCLGCPDMVGKNYHLFLLSLAGDFAHPVYEEARTQWVDDKNDMVTEFEFDDQPVVYMKYFAYAKLLIICKETKQNLGIILNYELMMWSVQDLNEVVI